MNKTSKSFFFLAALLTIAAALILQSLDNAQAAPGETAVATYSSGTLRVTIPPHGPRRGGGKVQVRDGEARRGWGGRRAGGGGPLVAGSWREEISFDKALAKPPSVDDLVWHRVRYRFIYADQKDAAVEGTESISEILRTPVVHILGQQSYLTGGQRQPSA